MRSLFWSSPTTRILSGWPWSFRQRQRGSPPRLISAVAWSDNGCFVLDIPELPTDTAWTYSRDFRLAGYDASVNRIWFTENPDSWVEQFGVEFA